ncbi:optineurin-like [Ruditapes philippinarum]|uniref:optineurin-like n=1 Tax=Ruditapes philippinarum TaxID=129788 RepID=UPI00295C208A|nr:optineurin-like [Ruditapes philippinarum]
MSSNSFSNDLLNVPDDLQSTRGSDSISSSSPQSHVHQSPFMMQGETEPETIHGDIDTPSIDKLGQLTDAVSNLRPILDAFRHEQMLKDEKLKQLTQENNNLKEHIGTLEGFAHLSPENTRDQYNKNLQSNLHRTECLLQEEKSKVQKLSKDIDELQAQLAKSKTKEINLTSENQKLEAIVADKDDLLKRNESSINDLYAENTNLNLRIEKLVTERDNLKMIVDRFKNELREKDSNEKRILEENESLTLQNVELEKMIEKVKQEKRKFEDEVTETKKRLSKVMGNKLTANNPGIADLSDQNRPTKLAEKYSELYDNEWTDAYEVFEKSSPNEKDAIKTLLNLLQSIQRFCSEMAISQLENISTALTMKYDQTKSQTEYFRQQIKDFRKATSVEAIEGVILHYVNHLESNDTVTLKLVNQPNVKPFMHKCVELCWLMAVQDPPLEFAQLKEQWGNKRFDTSIYKPYTQTGAFVDFVVWPPLYLHKDGQLLAKGVAQACGQLSSKDPVSKNVSNATAVPGTAVPVQGTCNNDKSRSFHGRSSKNTAANFSMTVSGASGFYDNNFSTIQQDDDEKACE